MKRLFNILYCLIFVTSVLIACTPNDRPKKMIDKIHQSEEYVYDQHDRKYKIVLLDGCRYYKPVQGHGLTRVDCECIPESMRPHLGGLPSEDEIDLQRIEAQHFVVVAEKDKRIALLEQEIKTLKEMCK